MTHSTLSDDEVLAEIEKITAEEAAGRPVSLEEMARRLGMTMEELIASGEQRATEIEGYPHKIVRTQ